MNTPPRLAAAALIAALATAARASAAEEPPVHPSTVGLRAMGGALGWTGGVGRITRAGPQWGALVAADVYGLYGLEAGYVGSWSEVDLEDGSGAVVRNGAVGMAKMTMALGPVRPYAGVGLGLAWCSPTSSAAELFQDDLILEIPFALGADLNLGHFDVGLRASYTLVFWDELAEPAVPEHTSSAGGALLGLAALVGWHF